MIDSQHSTCVQTQAANRWPTGNTTRTLRTQNLKQIEAIVQLRLGNTELAALAFAASDLSLNVEQAREFVAGLQDPAATSALFDTLRADGAFPKHALFAFCATLGDLACAFELAGELVNSRQLNLGAVWTAEAAPFRQDPRFAELMSSAGLADYWRRYGWSDYCVEENGALQCR